MDSLSDTGCQKPSVMAANTPYLLNSHRPDLNREGLKHRNYDHRILTRFASAPVAKALTNLALPYGGDNVVALAEIRTTLQDYNTGFMQEASGVYTGRIGGFTGAVKDYQKALLDYRNAIETRSPRQSVLKQHAHAAFNNMQTQFQQEMVAVTARHKARRGTPLSSVDRAMNIAGSSRTVARLHVADQVQASNLVKFSQHSKFLGNGLALIDFGSRAGNVHTTYKADGKWERELFMESSSFVTSTAAGATIAKAGMKLVMMATPAGWLGLVVGGLAVAGVAAGASIWANGITKDNAGNYYDRIVKEVSLLWN
jgi:hypothetical protein